MDSFLKDTPLETRTGPGQFRSYLQPEEDPGPVQAEADVQEQPLEDQMEQDSSAQEPAVEEPAAEESVAPSSEAEDTTVEPETAEPETPPTESAESTPGADIGKGEVVFEQVDGPKVEVLSEDGAVTKIIVHLAPEKILEINCEY